MVREDVGDDVWTAMRDSSIGVIIKLQETNYVSAAQIVHHYLTNQLAVER